MNSSDIAAWSALTVSVLVALFEVYKYLNNKPKLKITTNFNQEIMKMNAYGELTAEPSGKTFWSVDVANVGSKALIVKSIHFTRHGTTRQSLLTEDYSGQIRRYTLVVGDSHSYTIPDELIDPKTVSAIIVTDATGKEYKQRVRYSD